MILADDNGEQNVRNYFKNNNDVEEDWIIIKFWSSFKWTI